MLRTIAWGLFCLVATCGTAAADDFLAMITKVDDGKVTFHRREKPKEGERRAVYSKQEETLSAARDIKAVEARFNRETKQFDAGPDLPGGLSNEQLKDIEKPGVLARIITDDHDQIKELRIVVVGQRQRR